MRRGTSKQPGQSFRGMIGVSERVLVRQFAPIPVSYVSFESRNVRPAGLTRRGPNFRIVLFGLGWVVGPGWVVPREVGSSARMVRSRPPPLTPADGHCRCFWLRHRPRRAPCARRHRASNVIDRAACCVDAFFWLSSRAFCVPAGGRICVV